MSQVIVTLIAVLRTYLLKHPLRAAQRFTPQRVRIILVALFTVICLIHSPLPLLLFWQFCSNGNGNKLCTSFVSRNEHWIEQLELYFYAVGVVFGHIWSIVTIIFWLKMKRLLREKLKESLQMQQRLLSSPEAQMQEKRMMQVTKMFLAVLMFNAICIFTFCIHILAASTAIILKNSKQEEAVVDTCTLGIMTEAIAGVLVSLIPCCNFWIYLVLNKDFREEANSLFGGRLCPARQLMRIITSNQELTHLALVRVT